MVVVKRFSTDFKDAVIRLVNGGMSHREVARTLGISKSSVSALVRRFAIRWTTETPSVSGRPHVTSPREDSLLVRLSKKDARLTATDFRREFVSHHGLNVSLSTIQRRLRAAGLYGRRPAKKPLISTKNRSARVAFAKRHLACTSADWAKVIFSDESKFAMYGSDGIKFVRRPPGCRFKFKYQLPVVKHGGGSTMV